MQLTRIEEILLIDALYKREDFVYNMVRNPPLESTFWFDEFANINYLIGIYKHKERGMPIELPTALSTTLENAVSAYGSKKLKTAVFGQLKRQPVVRKHTK